MPVDAHGVGTDIVGKLEAAWNATDGQAFGAAFADDADFVDIRADHHQGRGAITAGHQAVLDTIYKGSRVGYTLTHARALSDDVLLAHVSALLNAPTGPLAGEHRATYSFVLTRAGDSWQIASFHNTLAQG